MYNRGHGLQKFACLYLLILYVALIIFFPSRVIFRTWKRRGIMSTFLRFKKIIKKNLTPNLINYVYCLLDFFKLKIQRSDTLGRCLLNALEFVDFHF